VGIIEVGELLRIVWTPLRVSCVLHNSATWYAVSDTMSAACRCALCISRQNVWGFEWLHIWVILCLSQTNAYVFASVCFFCWAYLSARLPYLDKSILEGLGLVTISYILG